MKVGEVRAATHDDVDACASVLAAAFQDDPGAIVFLPDDADRTAIMPEFFRTFVAAALSEDADIARVYRAVFEKDLRNLKALMDRGEL
jgi:hypothetical protein